MASSNQDFDMRESEETWHYFVRVSKWLVAGAVVVLIFMAYFLTGK